MIKAAYNPLEDLDDEVNIPYIPVKKGKYKDWVIVTGA